MEYEGGTEGPRVSPVNPLSSRKQTSRLRSRRRRRRLPQRSSAPQELVPIDLCGDLHQALGGSRWQSENNLLAAESNRG